jgi:hypothetical protein
METGAHTPDHLAECFRVAIRQQSLANTLSHVDGCLGWEFDAHGYP